MTEVNATCVCMTHLPQKHLHSAHDVANGGQVYPPRPVGLGRGGCQEVDEQPPPDVGLAVRHADVHRVSGNAKPVENPLE
jgi:hypothetical protein